MSLETVVFLLCVFGLVLLIAICCFVHARYESLEESEDLHYRILKDKLTQQQNDTYAFYQTLLSHIDAPRELVITSRDTDDDER